MAHEVPFARYLRAPKLGSSSASILTEALVAHAPPDLSGRQKAALVEVERAGQALRAVELARAAAPRLLPAGRAHDLAWSALRLRLVAGAKLPAAHPTGARARRLLARVFPQQLRFLHLRHEAEWVEARCKLASIDEEGLGPELAAVAGAEYLTQVRATHRALGDLLGLEGPGAPGPSGGDVAQAIARIGRAVVRYARLLLADVDAEEPGSVARFERALGPVDHHRRRHRARRSEGPGSEPATPEAPGS